MPAIPGRTAIKQRILTGLIAIPLLVLFILYAPPLPFHVLVWMVTLLGLIEFYGMALPEGRGFERWMAAVGGVLLAVLISVGKPPFFQGALAFLLLIFAVLFLLRFRDLTSVANHLALVFFGFLYLPLLLGHLSLLRLLPFGLEWIFLVLLVIMAGDSAAYFTGVAMGRRRLYPAISPKKSVEGAVGGLAGSLAGALLSKLSFFPELSAGGVLFFGLFIAVMGQLGDLFESMLKRSFGVKDSGTIIPGHGGILDRLDSLLFAFPLAYYYALWTTG